MRFFYNHKNGVAFRKICEADLPDLLDLKNESWFGTVNTACLNMTDQKKWFEKISNDKSCLFFAIHLATNPDEAPSIGLFGITAIDPINDSCEFTHSIYLDYRGKGYGTRSLRAGIDMTFEMFNMRRVETWILANNTKEQKVVKNVGFQPEGRKRSAIYKCGQYLDCILYGLLRKEWDESPETVKWRTHTGTCNRCYSFSEQN